MPIITLIVDISHIGGDYIFTLPNPLSKFLNSFYWFYQYKWFGFCYYFSIPNSTIFKHKEYLCLGEEDKWIICQ